MSAAFNRRWALMGGGNHDPDAPFLTMSSESHNFSTGLG